MVEAESTVKEITPILDNSCSRYIDILNELVETKEKKNKEKQQNGPSKGRKKSRKKKSSKQMYNKIAAECHPDKTDDEEKHEKFIKAKDMLESGDDYGLYGIFSEFSDELDMDDCFDIAEEILRKTIELKQLTTSNGYKICIIYKSGEQKKAKSLYLEMVMRNIQKLEQELM